MVRIPKGRIGAVVFAIGTTLAIVLAVRAIAGDGVDKDEVKEALQTSPLVNQYVEKDLGDGLTLLTGTAGRDRKLIIKFAVLVGADAVEEADRVLLPGVSTAEASAPPGSRDILFLANGSTFPKGPRRGVAYDIAIDLEDHLFDAVVD